VQEHVSKRKVAGTLSLIPPQKRKVVYAANVICGQGKASKYNVKYDDDDALLW